MPPASRKQLQPLTNNQWHSIQRNLSALDQHLATRMTTSTSPSSASLLPHHALPSYIIISSIASRFIYVCHHHPCISSTSDAIRSRLPSTPLSLSISIHQPQPRNTRASLLHPTSVAASLISLPSAFTIVSLSLVFNHDPFNSLVGSRLFKKNRG